MNINEILTKLKPSKGINLAKGMNSPVDEVNSDWTYSMVIENINNNKQFKIALLSGSVPTLRTTILKNDGTFPSIIGGYAEQVDRIADEVPLSIPDNPKILNHVSNLGADAVATNFMQNSLSPQILIIGFSDSESYVKFDSTKNTVLIDAFKESLKNAPLKLIETSIVSNSESQFSEEIEYGQLNQFGLTNLNKLDLSPYYKPESNRKKVIIDKEMYFDGNTIYAITIPSQTITTITWKFSYQFSLQEYFKQKTQYETILKSIK